MSKKGPRNIWFTSVNIAIYSIKKNKKEKKNLPSHWGQTSSHSGQNAVSRIVVVEFFLISNPGSLCMNFIIFHSLVTTPTVHLSVKYGILSQIINMYPTCPQSFGGWTTVWHLTKPSSRQHLEFLGIPSNTDPWRNRFLLQFHSLHTLTTKGCNFRVELELRDLDESCPVCCEFVEVCFKTCWHVELLNEKCVLLHALGEP